MFGRFLRYWLPVALWMFVIFGASTGLGTVQHTSRFVRPFLIWLVPNISEESIHTVHVFVRKGAHFTEYAILGLLLLRGIRSEPKLTANRSLPRQLLIALSVCALFAASDEFHQRFVANRDGRVSDALIDTAGATCGLFVFWGLHHWRKCA